MKCAETVMLLLQFSWNRSVWWPYIQSM